MNTTRRSALVSLVGLPILASAAEERSRDDKDEVEAFIGSWFVTSAVTSLIISVERQREALFLFIENGAYSIARTTWKPFAGGVLIEGFPRLRLWHGTDLENIRVEMEALPDDVEVSDGFRHFPSKFFMRRAGKMRVTPAFAKRPLPKAWENRAVDKDWDAQAGRRRL